MRTFLTTLLIFLTSLAFAQTAEVRGKLKFPQGNSLASVFVIQLDAPGNGVNCASDGSFMLTLPAGREITLLFKSVGIPDKEIKLTLAADEIREIEIEYDPTITEGGITIVADREVGMKEVEIDLKTKLPTINPGIESYLLQMPVNFASELSSSYSVRGGSFDENLVYVNGIQVYRPFLVRAGEQEGLSFPNPDMVKSIQFSAGGFSAKYGDKLSSVMDVTYLKPDSASGVITMGALGGSLQLGGRSKNKCFSHNTGVRYKNNAYIFNSLDVAGDYKPRYYDIQTYLTWRPERYSPWEFSFLGNYQNNRYLFTPSTRSTDVGTINEALRLTVYFDGKEATQFETVFGALSSRYSFSANSFIQSTISAFNTYETERFDIQGAYRLDELERDLGSDNFGDVLKNRGVGGFLDHARNALNATVLNGTLRGAIGSDEHLNTLTWGIDAQRELVRDQLSEWSLVDSAGFASPHPVDSLGYTNPNAQPDQQIYLHDVIRATNVVNSWRASAYIQNEKKWNFESGSHLTLNVGARVNRWSFNEQVIGGPRVSLAYVPTWNVMRTDANGKKEMVRKDLILSAAWGYYWQPAFYREMRGFDGRVNPEIRAQKSIHYILGAKYSFRALGRPFNLNTEVYYKQLRDLIPYEIENVRLRYFATNNSNGYAYGADVMLNGQLLKDVQSWLRVSYLKTAEDLTNDYYYIYLNSEGDTIYPGFTINDVRADSIYQTPGYIPRPNDQRVSVSLLFQDEMAKKPWYKVLLSLYYATGVPYGPPSQERYLDVSRTRAYIRADIGFSRDLILPDNPRTSWFAKTFDSGYIALEIFNLLGTNNIINHQWVQDVNGRLYGIPTYLTGRRINLRMSLNF
ncbi:MAG: TonB-dependent receptor plug domain-containing protein [Flavobacteriales bacterium]